VGERYFEGEEVSFLLNWLEGTALNSNTTQPTTNTRKEETTLKKLIKPFWREKHKRREHRLFFLFFFFSTIWFCFFLPLLSNNQFRSLSLSLSPSLSSFFFLSTVILSLAFDFPSHRISSSLVIRWFLEHPFP